MLVGYDDETKVCKIYLPSKMKVAISRDMTFDDNQLGLGSLEQLN